MDKEIIKLAFGRVRNFMCKIKNYKTLDFCYRFNYWQEGVLRFFTIKTALYKKSLN